MGASELKWCSVLRIVIVIQVFVMEVSNMAYFFQFSLFLFFCFRRYLPTGCFVEKLICDDACPYTEFHALRSLLDDVLTQNLIFEHLG